MQELSASGNKMLLALYCIELVCPHASVCLPQRQWLLMCSSTSDTGDPAAVPQPGLGHKQFLTVRQHRLFADPAGTEQWKIPQAPRRPS